MQITLHDKYGEMKCQLNGTIMDALRDVPGRAKWVDRLFRFEPSAANIAFFKKTFPDATWIDGSGRLKALESEQEAHIAAQHAKRSELPPEASAFPFKKAPRAHQLRAFTWAKARKWFALFMDMGCVDADTEYLSPEGWRRIADYSGGKVAQFHLNRTADFVYPTTLVRKPCAEMLHFKTRSCDQMLSEDHRILLSYRNKRKSAGSDWAKQVQDEWFETSPRKVVTRFGGTAARYGDIEAKYPDSFFIQDRPGIALSDSQIRLQIAFMADGHLNTSNMGTISVKRQRKKDRLVELLNDAGVPFTVHKGDPEFLSVYFKPPLAEKSFRAEWWNCSPHQLEVITEEVTHWDGCITAKGASYSSRHRSDADFVQYAFAATGRHAHIVFDQVWYVKAEAVTGAKNSGDRCLPTRPERVPTSDGFMYCFNVPSSYLIFRRNGKIFCSGNTGKTKTTIDIIASKWCSGEIETLLVFAPNGVHEQWLEPGCAQPITDPDRQGEVPKHMSDAVEWQGYVHRSGRKPPEWIFERTHKLRILCVNIEAMSHASGVAIAQRFVTTGKCAIVVDESTTIKTPGSARSKAVRKLGKQSTVRAILCGAPITRSIEDIYGQFLFLHEDALGFSSFYTFRNRYCDTAPAYPGAPQGVVRVTGHKNMEEFTQKVDMHSFRVTKDECLDLPPKVFLQRRVELTAEQKRLYKEIAEECYAQLGNRIVDVPSAVGKILRLQQVVCGHLPGETEGSYETIPSNRISSMLDWLEDCGDKVVIWARFIADVDQICAALGKAKITHVRYDGQVTQSQRQWNREQWLTDSRCRVMVSNPAAAARGQNWQIAQDVGYFSNSFDADHRWQSEDRTHRDGMKGTCTYTDFVAPGVETKILAALRGKKNVATAVLDDPKAWQEVLKI